MVKYHFKTTEEMLHHFKRNRALILEELLCENNMQPLAALTLIYQGLSVCYYPDTSKMQQSGGYVKQHRHVCDVFELMGVKRPRAWLHVTDLVFVGLRCQGRPSYHGPAENSTPTCRHRAGRRPHHHAHCCD